MESSSLFITLLDIFILSGNKKRLIINNMKLNRTDRNKTRA